MEVDLNYIQETNRLVSALEEGLLVQQLALSSLKDSLEAYQEFLIKSMKEMRDA